ncbi:hypothetical protein WOC12_00385 [Vibrio parahaemolyticus]|uniref:hypothetical protein n=1 Tax=Vibrio harveyi group TaxID=717610 RepID=UPI00081C1559|nr:MULTISPECIES: hypothetical protein [Vibrio harveyi group]EJE4209116.1 hypothetical protein [Vibrio parahaemolyticus]MCR9932643.1 hypothetical protein [Vibrio antiquarius]MDF4737475.1 hypothetical protein [Vibrio parahaemolyticus]OXD13312.1 hypothetical protein CA165_03035 [Vibrio parahaemolyticus]
MTQLTYKGFHACKNEGGYKHIVENIPFKSGDGKDQWLTQGYYFWTDYNYWAKQWRKENMPLEQKVIGEFDIKLCHETELLDLVGNVAHQFEFHNLKKIVLKTLPKEEQKKVTVHQIIKFLRAREEIFPYSAIKAQDGKSLFKLPFVDPEFSGGDMSLVTRQQLCVFDKAKDRICLKRFDHPKEYDDQFQTK